MMKKSGFTLIEILLVTAIAVGIFAFSAPYGLNFYRTQLVEGARSEIIDALQRARHYAVLQKNDSSFGVKIDSTLHNYVLFQGASYAGREETLDEIYDLLPEIEVSGVTEVVFSKLTGLTSDVGTTTLAYDSLVREILIESMGGVSKVNIVIEETVATYTVTFDANTGSGTMSPQTIDEGASANLTANSFSKTGYTFAGWNTEAGGGGTDYADEASYTMGTGNVTLYAQWTAEIISLSYISKIGTYGIGNNQFSSPQKIATDGTYLYIADTENNRIVKRLASNLSYVSKIGTGGTGNDQVINPCGITTDGTYLYIADTNNHRIVKRLASDLSYVSQIGTNGIGDDQFANPRGVATDGTYLYVADGGRRIVKRLASDLSYVSQIGTDGSGNDQFNQLYGVATDGTYLYMADTGNHRIVKRLASDLSYVSQIGTYGIAIGIAEDQFYFPRSVATDGTYLYVSDTNNRRIVKRLASDLSYISQIGSQGSGNDQFSSQYGIAIDGTYLYVADTGNQRIVKRYK